MKKLSLFSGIGGIDLAAKWAGMETVAFCEREEFPQRVLQKNFPGVPIYDDVCTLTKERLEQDGIGTIDIISAGYPCQPFSHAGKRRGKEDDRHLWPEVARLIREIKPRWFVGENVAGHITMGLDDVLADLENEGYETQTFVIPSASVGAPHKRERVFIVGYTERSGCDRKSWGWSRKEPSDRYPQLEKEFMAYTEGERSGEEGEYQSLRSEEWLASSSKEAMADPASKRLQRITLSRNNEDDWSQSRNEQSSGCNTNQTGRSIESCMGRTTNGIPGRLDKHRLEHRWPAALGEEQYDWEPPRIANGVKDRVGRLKGLGNAVNPHQIYPVLAALKAVNDSL